MISETQRHRAGSWGLVGISAIAVILVAASTEHDAGWERLRAMPAEERARLLANLRRFDLELQPEQQSSVRELDRRLSELSPDRRAQYVAVLRRYHAWLNSLPENRQGELAAKPPGERMALVRKLILERPVPTGETLPILRVLEPGELSPFEVASAYKIWQALDATQRAGLDRRNEHNRREALLNAGARMKNRIPRETVPADFDEEKWIGLAQDYWRGTRPLILQAEDAPKRKFDDTAKPKTDAIHSEFLRRQAINLYVMRTKAHAVESEHLARFVAALPEWLQTSFDPLPPDEARRRLTFAYRLVFPYPEEIGSPKKPADTATKSHAAPVKRPAAPSAPKRKPAETGEGAAPF
jgi:hypothetical protein